MSIRHNPMILFFLVGIVILGVLLGTHIRDIQAQYTVCPNGQSLGNGMCKDEPTGCPYGDSIPVDSPKCVPPNDIPVQVETAKPAEVSKCE